MIRRILLIGLLAFSIPSLDLYSGTQQELILQRASPSQKTEIGRLLLEDPIRKYEIIQKPEKLLEFTSTADRKYFFNGLSQKEKESFEANSTPALCSKLFNDNEFHHRKPKSSITHKAITEHNSTDRPLLYVLLTAGFIVTLICYSVIRATIKASIKAGKAVNKKTKESTPYKFVKKASKKAAEWANEP